MGTYNFRRDLVRAEETERLFLDRLGLTKTIKRSEFNKDYRYDILVEDEAGKITTYEIKHDQMAHITGNVAVEYESRGKLSGVSTSLADVWVYRVEDDFYCIPLSKLRKLVDDEVYFRTVTNCGDRNSGTCIYLFKWPVLRANMKKLTQEREREIKVIKRREV